jgi:hypothetical protein
MSSMLIRILAKLNKTLLPKMWHRDLQRLGKLEKLIVAWRYWVTTRALR